MRRFPPPWTVEKIPGGLKVLVKSFPVTSSRLVFTDFGGVRLVGERAKLKNGASNIGEDKNPLTIVFPLRAILFVLLAGRAHAAEALSYLPWVLLGVLGLVIVVVIACFLLWILVNVIHRLVGINHRD
jgi:hypothetical protein